MQYTHMCAYIYYIVYNIDNRVSTCDIIIPIPLTYDYIVCCAFETTAKKMVLSKEIRLIRLGFAYATFPWKKIIVGRLLYYCQGVQEVRGVRGLKTIKYQV